MRKVQVGGNTGVWDFDVGYRIVDALILRMDTVRYHATRNTNPFEV